MMAMKLSVDHHHPHQQAQQAVAVLALAQKETDLHRTLYLTPMIFLVI